MKVTVAICTWNRCDLLRQTLQQFTQLDVPEDLGFDLLVVNKSMSRRRLPAAPARSG